MHFNSTIFTTKNKELAILGKTLSETREKLIAFFEAFERGGIKGQDGIIGTFFSKDKKSPLTLELLARFEEFKSVFNSSSLSAEALAEQMENVDQRIIDYAKTCKNGEMTTNGFKASVEGMTLSAKVVQTVLKGLAIAGNILASTLAAIGISFVINGITKMIGASEEMSRQAVEATSKYKEQAASIDEYKIKITELKTALSDSNISYTDAREKRSQLIEIQKQLIDTYGEEVQGIDLINGSLDNQIDKLDELNKQKRQTWENEVNELTTGQKWQKLGGAIGLGIVDLIRFADPSHRPGFSMAEDWFNNFDTTTNIERIQKKVEDFSKSIRLGPINGELKAQLDSFEGVSFDGNKMTIAGDVKTVQDTITQIQTQVIGSREDLQWLDQKLKDIFNSAKKISDENWNTYNTALENQVLNDKEGFLFMSKQCVSTYPSL